MRSPSGVGRRPRMPSTQPTMTVEAVPVQVAAVSTGETAAAVPHKQKQQPKAVQAGEPVVTCNSQCDADSVINDIWKFLTA